MHIQHRYEYVRKYPVVGAEDTHIAIIELVREVDHFLSLDISSQTAHFNISNDQSENVLKIYRLIPMLLVCDPVICRRGFAIAEEAVGRCRDV